MRSRFYRFFAVSALAFWMGGFTFYAAVVVPTGSRLLGSVEQGLVTQQVTQWMNLSGVAALAILLPGARNTKVLAGSWIILALCLGALAWLHPHLGSFIDEPKREIANAASFYRWHQVYLAIATIQWSAGLIHLWGIVCGRQVKDVVMLTP